MSCWQVQAEGALQLGDYSCQLLSELTVCLALTGAMQPCISAAAALAECVHLAQTLPQSHPCKRKARPRLCQLPTAARTGMAASLETA